MQDIDNLAAIARRAMLLAGDTVYIDDRARAIAAECVRDGVSVDDLADALTSVVRAGERISWHAIITRLRGGYPSAEMAYHLAARGQRAPVVALKAYAETQYMRDDALRYRVFAAVYTEKVREARRNGEIAARYPAPQSRQLPRPERPRLSEEERTTMLSMLRALARRIGDGARSE
uniref:Uncharacterized protein n=1 Tax=uncultured prokaryote TaxID=198431 RepID=H5SEF7_9ZZZZ|nr:hypothetical protein HGMM_F16F12C09 [uncultured prokaryote]